ncbi:hypothetical protein V5799_027542 [Amblyomma americanum]|uniref:Uncharacterized protein n=1 Tax=Amblyomma americanum TaxID=6943 RepID=A0AAQ4DFF2_AMBAM
MLSTSTRGTRRLYKRSWPGDSELYSAFSVPAASLPQKRRSRALNADAGVVHPRGDRHSLPSVPGRPGAPRPALDGLQSHGQRREAAGGPQGTPTRPSAHTTAE